MPSLKKYLLLEQKKANEILSRIKDIKAAAAGGFKNDLDAMIVEGAFFVRAEELGRILKKDWPNAVEAHGSLNGWMKDYLDNVAAQFKPCPAANFLTEPGEEEEKRAHHMCVSLTQIFEGVIAAKEEAMKKTSYTAGSLLGIEDCIDKNCVEDIQHLAKQAKDFAATKPAVFAQFFAWVLNWNSESRDIALKSLEALLEDIEKMLGGAYVDPQKASQVLDSLAEKSEALSKQSDAFSAEALGALKALQNSLRYAAENAKIRQELKNLPPKLRETSSAWLPRSEKPEPPVKRYTLKSKSQIQAASAAGVATSQADGSKSPAQPAASSAEKTAPSVKANPATDTSLKSTAQARPTPAPRKTKVPLPNFIDEQSTAKFDDRRKLFEEKCNQQQEASCRRSLKP